MKQGQNHRILPVEDDADGRAALEMLFRLEGFEVITASDGQQPYLQAAIEQPDIIITDINMPYLSGLDLIRLIKQDRRLAAILVIVVSAEDSKQHDRAMQMGAVAVEEKPVH